MVYISELVSPPLLLATLGLRLSTRIKLAAVSVKKEEKEQVSWERGRQRGTEEMEHTEFPIVFLGNLRAIFLIEIIMRCIILDVLKSDNLFSDFPYSEEEWVEWQPPQHGSRDARGSDIVRRQERRVPHPPCLTFLHMFFTAAHE